jgi:hypothetical protein
MRTIRTKHDLDCLVEANVLELSFQLYLQSYFEQLEISFHEEGNGEEFTLHNHGGLYLVEKGDNIRDLHIAGLHREDGGLIGCNPEFVEWINLADTSKTYIQANVLLDNDYMQMMFLTAEDFADDAKVTAWFWEHLERKEAIRNEQL